MPAEWFEVAYINFDKAILHGRIMKNVINSTGSMSRPRVERMIEQVLSSEQKRQIKDMNEEHRVAMQKLLRSFVE